MANKTIFDKDLIQKLIGKKFGDLISINGTKHGSVQTNIIVITTKGQFVFRYYENRSLNYVKFELNVLKKLAKTSYPSQKPLKIGKYKNKSYVLLSYIVGDHIKRPTSVQLEELIKYSAKLHKLVKAYRPKNYQFREGHDVNYCLSTCIKAFKKGEGNKKRLDIMKKELVKIKFPNSVPKGVVHADYNLGNILFKKGKLAGVIDFDDSCYTYLIYDLGNIIYYFADFNKKKKINFTKAKEIIKTYNKYRKLNSSELNHIYDAIKIHILTHMTWSFNDNKWFDAHIKDLNYMNNIERTKFSQLLK